MQTCFYCQSNKLIWDWANGDIICTSCGTVNQERFIDDRCYYKDVEDHTYQETNVVDKKVNKIVSAVNSVLHNGMLDDTSNIAHKVESICKNEKVTTAQVVASVYVCEKGLTAKELCTSMNVKPNKFWKSVTNETVSENRLLDIIKRLVYGCVKIETKYNWSIIKCARRIIDRIKSAPEIQNIKTDKLAISLLYIACSCEKIKLSKKELVKIYGISLETLHRHEATIQTILKR
jgi:transcription initiation factor TFIIIB Brf1 subunit/transcription initiation factor TFIIB